MNSPQDSNLNELLAALPTDVLLRWGPQLEWLDMRLGQVLYESGGTPPQVFFPTTAIVSLLFVSENGSTSEIAVVGREGMVGISIFMGGGSTPSRAVVQCAGQGFRLDAGLIRDEFDLGGPAMHLMLRYTQALITQMAQTAVCNRHHSLDQQLCRWLLLSLDRLTGSELVMTQQLISANLGVRREGVAEAARRLKEAGVIRCAGNASRCLIVRHCRPAPASAAPLSNASTTACCRDAKPVRRRHPCAASLQPASWR